jgi:hypothetical protein
MPAKGIYIYGILPNSYSMEMFRSLEDTGVYPIPFHNLSAIVSDSESLKLDYSDRESLGHLLVHHQKTIEGLMERGFNMIIPMRLGTIAGSEEEVFKILASGYDLITGSLNKIEQLTEIDIAVSWADFPKTIKEIASDPDITSMKEAILKNRETILQVDQVKVGMMIQEKLKAINSEMELNILDSLSLISLDIKTHDVMNDSMITNSAFLINRNKKELFEKKIDQLDEEYKGQLNFKIVGPLPCYSFYTIEVKELIAEQIDEAKKELELGEETSESVIKKAYLEKARQFHPDAQKANGEEKNFDRINKAYHTLLEYSTAVRQSSHRDLIPTEKEKGYNNLILIKTKD